mgnify:FL=1
MNLIDYNPDLGTVWNNCILIKNKKQEFISSDLIDATLVSEIEKEFYNNYINVNPKHKKHNIWYDTEDKKCFCLGQYKSDKRYTPYLPSKEHSFSCHRKEFLNSRFGSAIIFKSAHKNKILREQEAVFNEEYIITRPDYMNKYDSKSVLVVAAGPSANEVKWENLDYDYVFSCNKFYNNKKFEQKPADLIFIAPDQELIENKRLCDYIDKYDSNICFEADRTAYDDIKRKSGAGIKTMHQFIDRYPNKCSLFNLRYQGAIGLGSRMVLSAVFLGAKNIYFVGLDGNTVHGPMHSFEKDKIAPKWCYGEHARSIQKRQYVLYWEYLLQLRNDGYEFNLYNLGEGTEHNVSSEISQACCPLTKEIKGLIK